MNKWVIYGILLLLNCGCTGANQQNNLEAAPFPASVESAQWLDVKEYGAVGNALYHHPYGEIVDEWSYRVGHYAELVEATYYAPYFGEAALDSTYTVIPDGHTQQPQEINLSMVRPGPTSYAPAVGDVVVAYCAVDGNASVPATDDSAAFEQAIAAGDGYLYLPAGDYMISQLTAAKIKGISGVGKIWIKEWNGGTIYYLAAGISDALTYQNYGWIDEGRFHDDAWRDMHWIPYIPEASGWTDSGDFSGNISPRMEYGFNSNRDNLNVWLTIKPTVEEVDFPASVTVCIADASANYSVENSTEWHRAAGGGIGGALYDTSWNEDRVDLPETAWKDCGSWMEITLKKEDLFHLTEDGTTDKWALHCWSLDNQSIGGKPVEFVCNTARVWVKEESAVGRLMCDIGGDMRTSWENRHVQEGYLLEACDSAAQLLTQSPRRFYAYTVPDDQYDRYMPFPI